MLQNLRSCRRRIEALADNQCKFVYTPGQAEHIIDQSANKVPSDSLFKLQILLK